MAAHHAHGDKTARAVYHNYAFLDKVSMSVLVLTGLYLTTYSSSLTIKFQYLIALKYIIMPGMEKNSWYTDRCFHLPPRAWILASDDGKRIRTRTVNALSLCCVRPINEVMPMGDNLVQQIKAYTRNQWFLDGFARIY